MLTGKATKTETIHGGCWSFLTGALNQPMITVIP